MSGLTWRSEINKEEMADSSNDYEIWFLYALIVAGFWLSDWVPFRSEYATYHVTCLKTDSDGACPAKYEYPGEVINFRPDTESQSVTYWIDGVAPLKFDNCAIVDVQNWSCPSASGPNSMIDGVLNENAEGTGYPHEIRKWKWWWLKFKKI